MVGKLTVFIVLVTLGLLLNYCAADLIWHNDEIPYESSSKCFRGHSYYTNHDNPNNTDINYPEGMTSLLDFKSESSCFYCICSVSGHAAECISRNIWYCSYIRYLRNNNSPRDMYASIFKQDRPTYFRQLSHRIRRTMDDSLFSLIEQVSSGDVQGSRRQLNAEKKCVPYVSQYSDCNAFNRCSGCTKCMCTGLGLWQCQSVKLCDEEDDDAVNDEMFETAISTLDLEIDMEDVQREPVKNSRLAPLPPGQRNPGSEEAYGEINYGNPIENIKHMLRRPKRSLKKSADNKHSKRSIENIHNKKITTHNSKDNGTIKFYSTIDELNEDTLKHSNISGTLVATKFDLNHLSHPSRRFNTADKHNNSQQIDFNPSKVYHHIADNKIDTINHDNKYDLSIEKLNSILGNNTQKNKDKELSKLVVNELKPGTEVFGDDKAPVTSNITFTSENDTLTAMAYIAGNLLNKLWSMEKGTGGSPSETDDMKHDKISDLLDLFKEPLNLKQETFLKNVLDRLSTAIDTDKVIKNGTICQTIEEATKIINHHDDDSLVDTVNQKVPCTLAKQEETVKNNQFATAKAISKINNVLGLLRQFQGIHSNLSDIKSDHELPEQKAVSNSQPLTKKLIMDTVLSKDEANSLNMYGGLLDKITKLLVPKHKRENTSSLINQNNVFSDDQNFKNNYKKMFNIDIGNMTVTAKDKIVLDYLTHINSKPDCLLHRNNKDTVSLPTIEGNILLNLSEFFKMKSIADLMNLIQPAKVKNITTTPPPPTTTTTTSLPITTTTDKTSKQIVRATDPNKLASTKEKLKAHLKTIIEDLIELRAAKGIYTKGNIKIADVLPCIDNIMNTGKDTFNKGNEEKIKVNEEKIENEEVNKHKKIVDILKDLHFDVSNMARRRSGSIMPVRPKSAVVLERVIKNLGNKVRPKTRRFSDSMDYKPYDKVMLTMHKIKNISSYYKKQALYNEVPAGERIVLLKVLQQEVKNYISALEGIKAELKDIRQMPPKKLAEIVAFILSSAANITLDEKVMAKIDKIQFKNRWTKEQQLPYQILKTSNANNNMKVSREQIIRHLIKKRMEIYMKMKQTKEFDVDADMNYNIAKRALMYLNNGNYEVAQDLYKMLLRQEDIRPVSQDQTVKYIAPTPRPAANHMYQQHGLPRQLHPVPFEEPKILDNELSYMSQDQLIKQLLNIKNMGV